jgi:hypothetical protein
LLGFNPLAILAAIAVAGAIWWTGFSMGGSDAKAAFGERFEKRLAIEREVAVRREVNLWTQIGDERRARIEMITTFQKIDTLSAEARGKLMSAIATEKRTSEAALAAALQNIQELKDASSELAEDWKRGAIPADIVCGVFNGKGCPAPAYPATGSDSDDGVEVRDGAGSAAPDASAGLP